MEGIDRTSVYKYGKDVIWSLPCLFQYEPVFGFFQLCLSNMGFDLIKANVYGSPSTVWSSGRAPLIRGQVTKEKLAKVFDYVQKINGTPTFTFSRIDITKDELKDRNANYLLDFGIERGARYIVSSDILRDYIKEKSPESQVVASILKSIYRFQGPNREEAPTVEAETNYYNKLLKEYDVVVLRPEYSKATLVKDTNLIEDLTRCEVLINQVCISNCPNAPLHSTILAAQHKGITLPEAKNFVCHKNLYKYTEQYTHNSAHTYDEVVTLVKAGVKHLKLQGRGEAVPYFSHAMSLATHMFNMEGPNIFLQNNDNMIIEVDKFFSIDKEKQWYFNNAFNGLYLTANNNAADPFAVSIGNIKFV